MTDELPQGWATTTLGDICSKPQYGWTCRGAKQGSVRYLRTTDISGGTINWATVPFCEEVPHDLEKYRVRRNDILVSRAGSVGVSFRIEDVPYDAVFASYLIRFNALDGVDPKFVELFLKSDGYWRSISEFAAGIAIPNVNASKLAALKLPLAPRGEQRRIVAKLATLLGKVEACQQRLAKIPILLKRFRQAVLAAACSGRLTADWREKNPNVKPASDAIERMGKATENVRVRRGVPDGVPVSDLVAEWQLPDTWGCYSAAELLRVGAFVDVKDGNHGANHPKVSDFTPTGLPFITAAQVNNYRIDYDGAYKLSGKALDRIRVGFAKSGDVIYTHKGSVGRVAVADRDCVLTPQTTYYRVNPVVFVNSFLMLFLASQPFSEQVNVVKEQTTRDFVPISEQYMLFHRVPPLAEQQEIVRRVEALFTLADQIEARYAKAKAHVEKFTPSLLARAFRGELVPQDPNDEPAQKLLERILPRTERSTSKKTGKGNTA
jgi:type I restriction enzyme, S subunit